MLEDTIKLRGDLKIYVGDDLVHEVNNTVVTVGKNYLASIMQAGTSFDAYYMQLGIGTTAVTAGDTGLQTPKGTRVAGTKTVVNNVLSIESVFLSNNPSTPEDISEAALFSASSGGTMFARSVFQATPKPVTDSLRIIWSITVG